MIKYYKICIFFIFVSLITLSSLLVKSQSLPVGLSNLEDYFRRQQLLGLVDSAISFNIRPLVLSSLKQNNFNIDSNLALFNNLSDDSSKTKFTLLPIDWRHKYTSHHPYGFNDGIMIPAKGYQTVLSGGVFIKSGIFNLQLRPEYLFAENKIFEEYPLNFNGNDVPQRFGNKTYKDFSWGQSRFGINVGPVSLALSNENLWWGPGLKNSILMSNTSTGFKHITFNTTRPLKTFIGLIETQVVAGNLENSGFLYPDLNDKRYFTGLVFNYQPRWLPGIFFGITRTFQTYSENLKSFNDYIPLFRPFQKVKDNNQDDFGSDNNDQITSVYVRWLLKKAHAEIYFEYGKNDNSFNLRDFYLSPQHSRANLIGFRKLIVLNKLENEHLEIAFEATLLSQSIDRILRGAGSYYVHGQILQGHTNRGEVLGAGIGPGGNMQTLNINWNNGFNRFGVQLERFEHQADFYDLNFASPTSNGQWLDFGFAAVYDRSYKQFLLTSKLQAIRSTNYQWQSGFNNTLKKDVTNLNIEVGITYFFNK